jgi:glycosyltransferase involved in cell wall biosynthesis
MKVGWLTSLSIIGLANYSRRLCEAMIKQDKCLQITIASDCESTLARSDGRVKVFKAWSPNTVSYIFRVIKLFIKHKVDIVHCQYEYWTYGRSFYSITFPILLLLLKAIRKPIVLSLHGVIPLSALKPAFFGRYTIGSRFFYLKKIYFISLVKLVSHLVSSIVVHSEGSKALLVQDYRVPWKKIHVIPHGLYTYGHPLSILNKSRKELGLPEGHLLLCFGEIRRDKCLESAIRAMPKILAKNPQTTLIIAGAYNTRISPESQGYLEELVALTKDLGLEGKVLFKINVKEGFVPDIVLASDILLFPYISSEIIAASGPLTMAIAYGKPVIATRIRRFTDILKDGENALLVTPKDSDELAKAVNLLLEDRDLKLQLSERIKLLGKGKSWDDVGFKTLNLYNELVAKQVNAREK